MSLEICAVLLDQHPAETISVELDGTLCYANEKAAVLLGHPMGVLEKADFFGLFTQSRADVSAQIRRCASSSSWQPLSLTLQDGAHGGLRLSLRCRGVKPRDSNRIRAFILYDENRHRPFEEHRRLIRELNGELKELRALKIQLDKALSNEIHLHQELIHRVKNNLTLLNSLIRLKANAHDDEKAKSALFDIQARVMAIALVHELLDKNKEINIVSADELLERLCAQMETSICPPGVTIARELTPYKLLISEATPLALLINELVTNSLKHAFTDKERGQVKVTLKRNGVDKIEVHVNDDGAGFDDEARDGTGERIIKALAQQLEGDISMHSSEGAFWRLIFKPTDIRHIKAA